MTVVNIITAIFILLAACIVIQQLVAWLWIKF